jgi:FKBP-type peptidyl-prolyl cis-trans isomerase 2
MKLGKFVRLEYTGTLENGDVFDSTDPKAVEGAFGSIVIILGAGHVIKGLEKALFDMKVGETRELDIPPEDGFGRRDPKKIKFYKLRQFTKEGVKPYPGLRVTIEGQLATVKAIASGRVVVDFNHPLAGLKLHYHVKMVGEVTDETEQIKELLRFHFGKDLPFSIKGSDITINGVPEYSRERLKDELATYTSFKNPRFVTLEGERYEEHNQVGEEDSEKES